MPSFASCACHAVIHQELWDFYKKAEACFWTAEELDFESDKRDCQWSRLNYGQRLFVETVLAFFAASDGIVRQDAFMDFNLQWKIFTQKRTVFSSIVLSNRLIAKMQLFEGLKTFQSIKAKADWA